MNPITNNVISTINKLERSKKKSLRALEKYDKMIEEIQEYAKKRFGTTFSISHITCNHLKGKIATQEEQIELLKRCLTFSQKNWDKKK